ncbi:MAG: aconitase X swivel domain-containing protein [Candidatus Bathyarchaeia archaeon]
MKGRGLVKGLAEGEALVSSQPISFLGGVDPTTGIVKEKGHELEGCKVTGKVLVFPHGKGSTVSSYILFSMARKGTKPSGIVNIVSDPIIAAGCVLGNIPLMDQIEKNPIKTIVNGDHLLLNATEGYLIIKGRYRQSA